MGPERFAADLRRSLDVIESATGNTARAREYARRFLTVHDRNDELRKKAEAIVRGES